MTDTRSSNTEDPGGRASSPCRGCGVVLDAIDEPGDARRGSAAEWQRGVVDGPTHPYMHASPACWAMFGEILAFEYSDPSLLPTHRLSVDTYAVQHPGDGSRQAIQSVGLHLARLMIQLESPLPPKETNDVMLRLGHRKASLVELAPPARFQRTLASVRPVAGTPAHPDAVRTWAQAAWQDWHEHHDYIRDWVGRARTSRD